MPKISFIKKLLLLVLALMIQCYHGSQNLSKSDDQSWAIIGSWKCQDDGIMIKIMLQDFESTDINWQLDSNILTRTRFRNIEYLGNSKWRCEQCLELSLQLIPKNTSNDYTDTWFIGFTPNLVAGLWVGFDDARVPLAGETGATAALPFWARFITAVYDSLDLLRSQFETSPNVIKVKVCKDTKKLITPYCPSPIEDIFNVKYMPNETCEIHKGLHPVTRERKKPF